MLTVISVTQNRWDNWSGTAAEMAEVLVSLLATYGLEPEPSPSERLVRYYVTEGALTRPQKEGREARFGYRQLIEFLVVRILLADSWPLARIAEFVPSAPFAALQSLLPAPTQAEAFTELEKKESLQDAHPGQPTRAEELVARFAAAAPPLQVRETPAFYPGIAQVRRRQDRQRTLKDALRSLGISEETPPRENAVRVTLAPWAELWIDPAKLSAALTANPEVDNQEYAEQLVEDAVRVFRAALEGELARKGKRFET